MLELILIILLIFIFSLVLPAILVTYVNKKKAEWKGRAAEKRVYQKLRKLPDEYVVMNNLLFQNNGHSVQIDHVVVSPNGVFVIETKGYRGWILGGENSEYWTQVIFRYKHKFYNPIRQNEGHVRFLKRLLQLPANVPFIPIVVFGDYADLKTEMNDHWVVYRNELKIVFRQYTTPVMDKATVDWAVAVLDANSALGEKQEVKQHKEHVNARIDRKAQTIEEGKCPLCGGQLVLRKGKYGKFYGCSNYPSCKFTINA